MTSQLSTQSSLIESIEVTNLGDFIMVTVLRWWWQNRYVSDFISKMSPTHPVSNIRHQHWCNQVYCVRIQEIMVAENVPRSLNSYWQSLLGMHRTRDVWYYSSSIWTSKNCLNCSHNRSCNISHIRVCS